MKIQKIGNLFGATGGSFAGNIYWPGGICPTINTAGGGCREPMILEVMDKVLLDDYNGRFHSSDREIGTVSQTRGHLALRNLWKIVEKQDKMGEIYKIRKLTTRECFRLQGVSDGDVGKIQLAGISDTQQYKLAGNSICVPVLEGIFTQMFRKDSDALF